MKEVKPPDWSKRKTGGTTFRKKKIENYPKRKAREAENEKGKAKAAGEIAKKEKKRRKLLENPE